MGCGDEVAGGGDVTDEMKRVLITMSDGSEFLFDYGMLSTKKLVAAINS